MRIIFLILATLIVTTACNKRVKETIGIVTPGPNEYRVQRNKPLEVPPHYELPEPVSAITESTISLKSKNLNEGEKALIEEIEGKGK